jgi:hypothetical protein
VVVDDSELEVADAVELDADEAGWAGDADGVDCPGPWAPGC